MIMQGVLIIGRYDNAALLVIRMYGHYDIVLITMIMQGVLIIHHYDNNTALLVTRMLTMILH